jgi:hypothetical protein
MRGAVNMGVGAILLICCVLLSTAALPVWSYNRRWDYRPSLSFGLLSLLTLLLLVTGRL